MSDKEGGEAQGQDDAGRSGAGSRPQQGGEGGTTRFGMEDGDNTDVPATGGPTESGGENDV
jgi:hypothetical protein